MATKTPQQIYEEQQKQAEARAAEAAAKAAQAKQGQGRVTSAGVGYSKQLEDGSRPVLAGELNQVAKTAGGTGQVMKGIFTGNKADIKRGAKDFWEGSKQILTGASLGFLNKAPERQYMGGSADALAAKRAMLQGGVFQGNDMMLNGLGTSQGGIDYLNYAAQNAMADRNFGRNIAGSALEQQAQALANSRAYAARPTDSLAQLQLQQGLAQNQMAMNAQAAQARGGNQAAAMRGAQLQGVNAAMDMNGQAAQLRAAEQQAMINRQLGVEQLAAQMGGQQLQQGLGMQQGGTGQLGQFGGQIGSVGLGQAQVGLGSQGQYLTGLQETDKTQLGADTQHASAAQASKGGILKTVGSVIGGIFG